MTDMDDLTDEQISQWQEAIKAIYGKYVIPQVSVFDGAELLLHIDKLCSMAKRASNPPLNRTDR